MMLSAWCLVASGQWLVASAVLPTLGGRAPYVGGTGSLRWRFGLPTLGGRSPYVGAARSVIAPYHRLTPPCGALGARALPRQSGRGRPPGGPEVGRALWASRGGQSIAHSQPRLSGQPVQKSTATPTPPYVRSRRASGAFSAFTASRASSDTSPNCPTNAKRFT